MVEDQDSCRDLAALVVARVGALRATGDPWGPYQLLDGQGVVVVAVAEYLKNLQAVGRPATTQRSYGMDLLRWFRFCWAAGVCWSQATRVEARDFCRWIQITAKPVRPRRPSEPHTAAIDGPAPGTPNRVTGKPAPAQS